jgi:hypothetical protein
MESIMSDAQVAQGVEVSKEAMLEKQQAVSKALLGLASTRTQRATKMLLTGDVAGALEEVTAVEEMLQKIGQELA